MSRSEPRSLSRHVVLAAVCGALVVAGVSVALALPLLRGVADDQSRAELVRTVETLARSPRIGAQLVAREQEVVGPEDRRYALVTRNGSVNGPARAYVSPQDARRLLDDGELSGTIEVDGAEYLVEGRAINRGSLSTRGAAVVAVQPRPEQGPVVRSLLRRLAIALLAGVVAGSVLALALARRATAPVREAAERAHRLAAGERGIPSPPPSTITEVDEMSAALTALDEALAGSEARQREFLLSISHELRTPLTALRGYAEALRDGAVTGAEVAEVGATLTRETERLDRFIADLLALARLEADDFRLETSKVDLASVLEATVTAWSARASGAGLDVRAEVPAAGSTELVADQARIRQILDGLVENALRVSAPGGQVVLQARREASDVVLEVLDDGPGLEPGDHERAFERGYLRERYTPVREVGTGLGLSIAHRLARRMGAELTAHPASTGGTLMRLRVPAHPPAP